MRLRQWEVDDFYTLLNKTNENIYHISKLFHFDPHYFKKSLRDKKINDKNFYNAMLYLKNQRNEGKR